MTAVELDAHVIVARGPLTVDVALRAHPGETVAVMGPSGAGKSTLLGAIAGLVTLDGGVIALGGERVAEAGATALPPNRRGAVLLGQHARLFPHLSATENVAFGPRARGVRASDARAEAAELLARVGLDGLGERMPGDLSGGQQQRVAVARALAARPRVLLLDEPLTSLDPETAADLRTMLAEQIEEVTAVIVTHDAVDAAALASRLVLVEDGAVTQEGAVADVLQRPGTRFAATIAGLNRTPGVSRDGRWVDPSSGVVLAASPRPDVPDGAPLAAVFRPADVRLEREAGADPAPRENSWAATIQRITPTPAGTRVHLMHPDVVVDIDTARAATLRLRAGDSVRLRVDTAEVRLLPVSAPAGAGRA